LKNGQGNLATFHSQSFSLHDFLLYLLIPSLLQFNVKEYSSKTPFEALQKIAEGEGWQISTKEYKYGLMVESVNKISNSSGGYWTYKIDGQAGKIAADRYTLKKGEAVEWEYVKADN